MMRHMGSYALAAIVLLIAGSASALTIQLDQVFNGDTPASSPTYLTAEFTNSGVDTVTLTLTSSLEDAAEYIHEVGFNIDPVFLPSDISVSQVGGPLVVGIGNTAQDAQIMTGTGMLSFDFLIEFDNAPPSNRLGGTDVAVFTLSGTGLTESDFYFATTGGTVVGAHVHGIVCTGSSTSVDCLPGGSGTTSGAISQVPEPGTALLMGMGLAGLAWNRRAQLR